MTRLTALQRACILHQFKECLGAKVTPEGEVWLFDAEGKRERDVDPLSIDAQRFRALCLAACLGGLHHRELSRDLVARGLTKNQVEGVVAHVRYVLRFRDDWLRDIYAQAAKYAWRKAAASNRGGAR